MSDDISMRYSKRRVLVVGNADIMEPVHQYQQQWMSHWTQACSSSCLETHRHCGGTSETTDRSGHCYLPVGALKQSYPCECRHRQRCDLHKASYMLKSVEAQEGENGQFRIINSSIVQHNLKRSSSETLGKISKQKLPASTANWRKFTSCRSQSTNNPTSELSHFPVFDMSRKLESIMALRKQTTTSSARSPLAPHSIEFVSEGHHYQQQGMVQFDEESNLYESLKPSRTSIMENDEGNDLFCSGLAFKEQFANANLTYLKHELCNGSKHPTIMASEMKNDSLRCHGSSCTRQKDGSNYDFGDIHCPTLSQEQIFCDRYKTTPDNNRANRTSSCSHGSKNAEPEKCSFGTQHLLIRKEAGVDLCHKDQISGDSTASATNKGTAFFKKAVLPSNLCLHGGQQEENLQNLVSSTDSMEDVGGMDTQFRKKENEVFAITCGMQIDVQDIPSSPEGAIFTNFNLIQLLLLTYNGFVLFYRFLVLKYKH